MTVDRPVCYCQPMAATTTPSATVRPTVTAAATPRRRIACPPAIGYSPRPTNSSTKRACTPSASIGSSSAPASPRRRSTTRSAAKTSWFAPILRAVIRARQQRITRFIARYETPRARLLGVFDALATFAAEPGYRGCAFFNASAESLPGGAVEEVSDESRAWTRSLFTELAAAAGAPDPAGLATQLVLLYDGATVGARMDRTAAAAAVAARAVAATLLDAALGQPTGKDPSKGSSKKRRS